MGLKKKATKRKPKSKKSKPKKRKAKVKKKRAIKVKPLTVDDMFEKESFEDFEVSSGQDDEFGTENIY